MLNVDEDIKDYSQSINNPILDVPMFMSTLFGEPYTPLIIGGGLILSGNSGNQKNKRIGFEILQANLYSVTITQLSKMLLGRSRPYKNEGADNFTFFSLLDDDFWSMPSGHTTVAFATFTTLSVNSENKVNQVLYMIPAFLTGISRIYHDKHWSSDVFLGAAIGYFTARFVNNLHDNLEVKNNFVQPQTSNIFKISLPL